MYAHSNALITDVATFYYSFFAHPLTHSRKELCNTRNEYHFFHTNSITVDTWLFSNVTCVRVSESECAHNSLHQSANKLIPFVDAPLSEHALAPGKIENVKWKWCCCCYNEIFMRHDDDDTACACTMSIKQKPHLIHCTFSIDASSIIISSAFIWIKWYF